MNEYCFQIKNRGVEYVKLVLSLTIVRQCSFIITALIVFLIYIYQAIISYNEFYYLSFSKLIQLFFFAFVTSLFNRNHLWKGAILDHNQEFQTLVGFISQCFYYIFYAIVLKILPSGGSRIRVV